MSEPTPAGLYFKFQSESVGQRIAGAFYLATQMQSAAGGLPVEQVEAARKSLHAIKAHLRDALVLLHATFPLKVSSESDAWSVLAGKSPPVRSRHSER
jgi:hypothetical protein